MSKRVSRNDVLRLLKLLCRAAEAESEAEAEAEAEFKLVIETEIDDTKEQCCGCTDDTCCHHGGNCAGL